MDTSVQSFKRDHLLMTKGLFLSGVDPVSEGSVSIYDLRMTLPNREPPIDRLALHTIEHLAAHYLRSHVVWGSKVVYFGPMGCSTGCYLILKGVRSLEEVRKLLIDCFRFVKDYDEPIVGAEPSSCGNWTAHNLTLAKYYAEKYLDTLIFQPQS